MSASACKEIMGMPVTVDIADEQATAMDVEVAFERLRQVDRTFSTFDPDSETERLNRGEVGAAELSVEMRLVLDLCERTRNETGGYFDARYAGRLDPSGLVKGYGIARAADVLRNRGYQNFVIEAGGDLQTSGRNQRGHPWRVGIKDPFDTSTLFLSVALSGGAIATSGCYERGAHIFDPVGRTKATAVASVSVIAGDICDADRLATAAFAMGEGSIVFLERTPGVEGLLICLDGSSYCTTGFPGYLLA